MTMKNIINFLVAFLLLGFFSEELFSQNTECQPIMIDNTHYFWEDFSDYDSVAVPPCSNSTASMPTCWQILMHGTGGAYAPKIVKGDTMGIGVYNGIKLSSNCLQMRVNYYGQTETYAILPRIATNLNALEVGFSLSSAISDSSCVLSLGYLTNDSVFEEVDFVSVTSFRNSYLLTDSSARYEVSLEGIDFPTDARLAFHLEHQYHNFYVNQRKCVFIDDILIRPIPSCRKPFDIEAVTITGTSATLRWQPTVADSPCRVEYGPAGFAQGTGTILVCSSNSVTLHPLMESTEYEVHIQTLCGGTDTSEAAVFHFQTSCPAIVVDEQHPYFEDFADSTFACWQQRDGHFNGWQSDIGRLFSDYFGNGTTRRLQSPTFDLSSLQTATCIFSYQLSAVNLGTELNIYYRNAYTSPWTLLKTCTEITATDTVILPYLSDNYQISFIANKQSNEISIFSVQIEAADDCLAPPTPHLLWVEGEAAQIGWDTYYQDAAVELEYGPAGFVLGTGTRVSATGEESSRWISNLLPNTVYEVYVRQECAGEVWSDWSLPLAFNTECTIITLSDSVLYTENFEGMSPGNFPNCWKRFSEGADETYFPQIYQGDYTPTAGSTALILTGTHLSSQLWSIGSQCGVALPQFSNPLSELELRFTTAMTSTHKVTFEVGYLNVDEEFTPLTEIPCNHYFSQNRGVTHVLRLRDYDIPDTLRARIAFRWSVDTVVRNSVCLDDILVRTVLDCDYPLGLRVTGLDDQTYAVTWQPQDSSQNLWDVELSGTHFTVHTDSCYLGALTADADYYVIVRALCGDNHSYWSDTLFFHTACECYSVRYLKPYFEDFTNYICTYNVFEMADQPDCWSFYYSGYYEGFAPHVYNGSFAINNPSLLMSLGVEGGMIGRELYAVFPPFCNDLEELRVEFDLYNSRDTIASTMLLGYLTDRYDTTTFHLIDTISPHFYGDPLDAHRCYYLQNYATPSGILHLAFKLNSYDQSTHFYSVDNVRVSLATDTTNYGIDNPVMEDPIFAVYPNPTSGMVNACYCATDATWDVAEIQVFDVYGRLLHTVETCHGASLQTVEIDLSQYAPGVYLIQMVGDGRVMGVRKMVKR